MTAIVVKNIPLQTISISDFNVRKDLDAGTEDSTLDDLAKSINEKGLLNPVTVLDRDGKYELIIGKRRYLAYRSLGWRTIPAIVRKNLEDTEARILSLIENVHRADLHPIDKARAYTEIYDEYGTYTRVSKETGVSISTVRRYMFLLKLAPDLQKILTTSDGPAGICTLYKLAELFPSFEDQEYVYERIMGFKQQVQLEILKRSNGDIDEIDKLCEQALGGFFKVAICRGIEKCPFIPQECLSEVKRIIEQTQPILITLTN